MKMNKNVLRMLSNVLTAVLVYTAGLCVYAESAYTTAGLEASTLSGLEENVTQNGKASVSVTTNEATAMGIIDGNNKDATTAGAWVYSASTQEQTATVDLGAYYSVSEIKLYTGYADTATTNQPGAVKISYSLSGQSYIEVVDVKEQKSPLGYVFETPAVVRYIKVAVTKAENDNVVRVRELEVYGALYADELINVAEGAAVSASAGDNPQGLVDGYSTLADDLHVWSYTEMQEAVATVDLGENYSISESVVYFGYADGSGRPDSYKIDYSLDGVIYKILDEGDVTEEVCVTTHQGPVCARYLRLSTKTRSGLAVVRELETIGVFYSKSAVENLRITGLESVGSTIAARWTNVGGAEPGVKWYRCPDDGAENEIAGADGVCYTLTQQDVGCKLFVELDADGLVYRSVPTGEIKASGLYIEYDDLKTDGNTATVAYRVGGGRCRAELWTISGAEVIDYKSAELIDAELRILKADAVADGDVYAISVVIDEETGAPVLGLVCGEENIETVEPVEGEGLRIETDPVTDIYTLYKEDESAANGEFVYFIVESAENNEVVFSRAALYKDGVLCCEFKFPQEALPGNYRLKLFGSDGGEPEEMEIYYVTAEYKKNVLEELSPTETGIVSGTEFAKCLTENNRINMSILQISDKYILNMSMDMLEKVGESMVGKKYTYETIEKFYTDLRYAAAMQMLFNPADSKSALEIAEYYKDIYELETSDMYAQYATLEKPGNVLMMFKGENVGEQEEIKNIFERSVLIQLINEAPSYGKINKYFEDYREIFTFDLSKYDNGNKEKIALYLLTNGGDYTKMDDIEEDIEKALKNSGSSGYGGGSGGSGGYSGISGTGTGAVHTAIEVEKGPGTDSVPQDIGFSDIEGHWAENYIRTLKSLGVVNGDENGSFNPDSNIAREEFVKMVVLAFGINVGSGECGFEDVEYGSWAESYIAAAAEQSIIQGISERKFGIGMQITRQDIAVIIFRILGNSDAETDSLTFTDEDEIADYAVKSVRNLAALGIISGFEDGSFAPEQYATRSQAAKLLCEALKLAV